MDRRRALKGLTIGAIVSAIVLAGGLPHSHAGQDPVCPKCGAPLEPGAAFCGSCGAKLEGAPAPGRAAEVDRRGAVVQVVAAHDTELTSTLMSLAFEANVPVASILGSAFAIAPGEFVTDSGILVGAREVSVRIGAGRTVPARVIGADAMIGVALLKAEVPDVPVLTLRRDEPPRTGETLTVIGFPSGFQSSGEAVVSAGVVSGLHRSGGIHPIEDYLQTDASQPRGIAGGPMLDPQGRVVGMTTALVFGAAVYLGPQSGIGFAIPAEWVGRALDWIRAGSPPRAWIGAYAVAADPESRAQYRLSQDVKLVVQQIFPGSPAAAAGIARGDGLLRVHGEGASALASLHQRLLTAKPGEEITVELSRAGETRSIPVTLAERPAKPRLSGVDSLRFFGGVEIKADREGRPVVAALVPGSGLAGSGVAPGDALLSVLSKKDWVHGARDNSRWRSVKSLADVEARVETAYSDLDFCLGLRFRIAAGARREVLIWEILTPTAAL